MIARISLVLLTALFSLPALAETMNGNWLGTGSVEIAGTVRPSRSVTYTIEQTATSLNLKTCNYLFDDGSFVTCSPFVAEIRNGSELWASGKQVGTISDAALNVAMEVSGFQVTMQATFAQSKMKFQYVSTATNGQKLVMQAGLARP